jgi:hypothetical protein
VKIVCNYNDYENLPKGTNLRFNYGLEIGKTYLVMGIAFDSDDRTVNYLLDDNGRPNLFPQEIFKIVDNSIPTDWFISPNVGNITFLGFDELCNQKDFYEKLVERDESTMRVYYRRKIELENTNLF